MALYSSIKKCRICSSDRIKTVFDLGTQPLANSLRSSLRERLPKVPLAICRCERCATVQLTETVKPEYLFKNYVWVTGTSAMAREYSMMFYRKSIQHCPGRRLFVVEIASNDGTFLMPYKDSGHRVLGVDPAQNIARMANEKGIPTQAEFFGQDLADDIVSRHGKADIVFARNVLPHVANIEDVVLGMRACINAGGIGIAEFHYARVILDDLHYDSIYHEHLFYFSLGSFSYLLEKHGLQVFDVMKSPINGGSIALYFSHEKRTRSRSLTRMFRNEEKCGLNSSYAWKRFSDRCLKHRAKLASMVRAEADKDRGIIGYGASARSSTLLNFCGIDSSHLLCIADMNPLKQGKYTAGTDILILPPDAAFSRNPGSVLLLAWNFRDEVLSLLKDKYRFRGKVIIPLPRQPKIINLSSSLKRGR